MKNSENPKNGANFENEISTFFSKNGVDLKKSYRVSLDVNSITYDDENTNHNFDFGSDEFKYLIECKRHTWTSGNNVPSAKMSVWNEAMYYFLLATKNPYFRDFKKILIVLKAFKDDDNETLASYYIKRFSFLIPREVEIWEYDPIDKNCYQRTINKENDNKKIEFKK